MKLDYKWLLIVLALACNNGDSSGSRSSGGDPGQLEVPDDSAEEEAQVDSEALAGFDINSLVTASADSLEIGQINLVPEHEEGGASLMLSTSDIQTAEQTFSWNPADEPLNNANKILCAFGLTGANLMANRGPYIAKSKVVELCFTDASSMGTNTAGAGNSADNLPQEVVVNSSKPTNKALTADVYFTIDLEDFTGFPSSSSHGATEEINIYLRAIIAERQSAENPLGVFRIVYQGYESTNGAESDTPMVEGYVDVAKTVNGDSIQIELSYHETVTEEETWGSDTWRNTRSNQARVFMYPAGADATHGQSIDSSSSRTSQSYSWEHINGSDPGGSFAGSDESGSYSVYFSANEARSLTKFVKAAGVADWWGGGAPETPKCHKTDRHHANVWNYGIFDSSGSQIHHQTGFAIQTGKTDSWGWPIVGWLDNWGLWVPNTADGDTVYYHDLNTDTEISYTFVELDGTMKNSGWQTIVPGQNLDLICPAESSCPKANITDTASYTLTDYSFTISTGSNDKIDFTHSSTGYTATIAPGSYSASTLASEIDTKLDAQIGSNTFNVTYDSMSGAFTIATVGSETFDIDWTAANTIAADIGFDTSASDTGAATYTSDDPIGHPYRYIATTRKLHYDPSGANSAVALDSSVLDGSFYTQMVVTENNSDTKVSVGETIQWEAGRSRWDGMNLNYADDSWFDAHQYSDWGANDIDISCASNCPKHTITQADIDGSSYTQGSTNYYFSATNWALYDYGLDATKDGGGMGDDRKVQLDTDVANANLDFTLTIASGAESGEDLNFNLYAESNVYAAGLQKSGAWLLPNDPVYFVDRAYNDSADAYPYNGSPSNDGAMFSTLTSDSEPLSYDGFNLCCFGWESKSHTDQWGNNMWGPQAVLKSGTSMVAANTTGSITAGDTILISPLSTELVPHTASNCSASMHAKVNAIPSLFDLPSPYSSSDQNIKDSMPSKPTQASGGGNLPVKIRDGNCALENSNGTCK